MNYDAITRYDVRSFCERVGHEKIFDFMDICNMDEYDIQMHRVIHRHLVSIGMTSLQVFAGHNGIKKFFFPSTAKYRDLTVKDRVIFYVRNCKPKGGHVLAEDIHTYYQRFVPKDTIPGYVEVLNELVEQGILSVKTRTLKGTGAHAAARRPHKKIQPVIAFTYTKLAEPKLPRILIQPPTPVHNPEVTAQMMDVAGFVKVLEVMQTNLDVLEGIHNEFVDQMSVKMQEYDSIVTSLTTSLNMSMSEVKKYMDIASDLKSKFELSETEATRVGLENLEMLEQVSTYKEKHLEYLEKIRSMTLQIEEQAEQLTIIQSKYVDLASKFEESQNHISSLDADLLKERELILKLQEAGNIYDREVRPFMERVQMLQDKFAQQAKRLIVSGKDQIEYARGLIRSANEMLSPSGA